jgi:folylpolyglutamate synthase/dihydropteroate synthase
MIAALARDADEIIAVPLPDSGGQEGAGGADPRAIVSEVMGHRIPALAAPDIVAAVKQAAQRGAHRIYVAGSLYLCGAALSANGETIA